MQNIYAAVVFDLHPKVRGYIDQLNQDGQIDLDQAGYPYLVRCDKQGPNFVVQISRNNQLEQFTLNPRKKAEPVCSWNSGDGFQREPQRKTTIVQPSPGQAQDNRERARRVVAAEAVRAISEAIFEEMDDTDQRDINGWRLAQMPEGSDFRWEAKGPDGFAERFHSYSAARDFAMKSTRYTRN